MDKTQKADAVRSLSAASSVLDLTQGKIISFCMSMPQSSLTKFWSVCPLNDEIAWSTSHYMSWSTKWWQ